MENVILIISGAFIVILVSDMITHHTLIDRENGEKKDVSYLETFLEWINKKGIL